MTLTFDGLRRIVWIAPLAEAAAYSAGDLCRRHAERFGPPRNWEVHDLRVAPAPPVVQTLPFPEPRPDVHPEPRPDVRPTPVTVVTPPIVSTPGPAPAASALATRIVAHPSLPGPPVEATAAPTSPLLARAFRNAG